MRFQHMVYNILRSLPFRVGLLGGLCGVFVDLDHIVAYYIPALQQWYPEHPLRCFHIPLFIMSSIVICGLGAYLGRLWIGMVLRRRRLK